MAHTEFHQTCLEYLTKQTAAYKNIVTIEDAKNFWTSFITNIHSIQEKIEVFEKAEAYRKELASQGLIIQATIDHVALRKALGLNAEPEFTKEQQPEPEPEPLKLPAYRPEELVLIQHKQADWSDEKVRTVIENPDIHPDSILSTGKVARNYWTWDEIHYLYDNAKSMTIPELTAKLPEHAEQDIVNTALSFGIHPVQPKTEPTCLEDCLPKEIQNPNLAMRLRIFRIKSNKTTAQIVSKTRFNKTYLQDIENGNRTPSQTDLSKLAQAYNVTVDNLIKTPIAEILPFDKKHNVPQRIRTLRIRTGYSVESFACKFGVSPDRISKYENGSYAPNSEFYEKLEIELHVPAWIIQNADFENYKAPTINQDNDIDMQGLSTGEKLTKWRTSKHLTIAELAQKAGCSDSHIYNIENQKTHPSDDMLIKIAQALNIQPYQLIGENIRQPNSVLKEKAQQNRAAKPTTQVLTAKPTDIPTRIREARNNLGYTQRQLAELAKVPLEHIVTLETEGLTGSNGHFYRKTCSFLGILS